MPAAWAPTPAGVSSFAIGLAAISSSSPSGRATGSPWPAGRSSVPPGQQNHHRIVHMARRNARISPCGRPLQHPPATQASALPLAPGAEGSAFCTFISLAAAGGRGVNAGSRWAQTKRRRRRRSLSHRHRQRTPGTAGVTSGQRAALAAAWPSWYEPPAKTESLPAPVMPPATVRC